MNVNPSMAAVDVTGYLKEMINDGRMSTSAISIHRTR